MTGRRINAAELQAALAAANRIAQAALDEPSSADAKWLDASLANLQRGFRDITIAQLRKMGVLERMIVPAPEARVREVEFRREGGKLRTKVIEMPPGRAGR